jgi:hypothetical protein
MPVAVILLSVVLMLFMALASAVQRTIRALGLRRSGTSETPAEVRAQTMIVLGIYLRWVNAAFLLAVAVYLIAARASTWYVGVALVTLCWIGSLLMGTTARLRPDGAEMVTFVIADLERRREWYRAAHNAAYLHAVEDLLTRIRSAPGTHLHPGSSGS